MNFSYDMTISDLVDEMNSDGSQEKLYEASKAAGRTIKKNVIPLLFKVAEYEREGGKYVAKSSKYENATVAELLPIAEDAEKARKAGKRVAIVSKEKSKIPTKTKVDSSGLENRLVQIPSKEATEFILSALDLTLDELSFLKKIAQSNVSVAEPIHEAIKKLNNRERANKTYYVSKEIVELVADFAKEKNIKVSEFVELALLEAIEKYK